MSERSRLEVVGDVPERVLVITRRFDAPRALVFETFVDPKHARHWLGPPGTIMTHLEGDVRPGGRWRGCMRRLSDGAELWHGGVYRAVIPNRHIAFTFKWDHDEFGPETLVTVTFEDHGSGTLMHFRQGVFETTENRDAHRVGWESEFDRLSAYMAEPGANRGLARSSRRIRRR